PGGDSLPRPQPGLGGGLAAEPERRGAVAVQRGALRDQLVPADQPVDQPAGLGVGGEAAALPPALVIEHHDRAALTDRLVVAEGDRLVLDRAAVHPQPQAVLAAGRPGGAVVQVPDLDPAGIVPPDPAPERLVVEVAAGG